MRMELLLSQHLLNRTNSKDIGTEANVLTDIEENRANQNFVRNLKTSLLMGVIITVFFVPVCSDTVGAMIFDDVTYFRGEHKMSSQEVESWLVNRTGAKPRVVHGLDLQWFLGSPDLKGYWPNVVQFVFFTIYLDFGTTMQYAYQGMAGTILAEINIFLLLVLLPHGGRCQRLGEVPHLPLKQTCLEYANPDYGSWGWALFAVDNVLVTAASFILNIGLPVKKWFLCWNCVFMMQFASYDGMERSHSVLCTTVIGCVLALASMLPRLRIKELTSAPQLIVDGLERTLRDMFNFLEPDAKRFDSNHRSPADLDASYGRIESSVIDLQRLVTCIGTDLEVTWWETLNIRHRRARKECQDFVDGFSLRHNEGGLPTVLHLLLVAAAEGTKSWEESSGAMQVGGKFSEEVTVTCESTSGTERILDPASEGSTFKGMYAHPTVVDDETWEAKVVLPDGNAGFTLRGKNSYPRVIERHFWEELKELRTKTLALARVALLENRPVRNQDISDIRKKIRWVDEFEPRGPDTPTYSVLAYALTLLAETVTVQAEKKEEQHRTNVEVNVDSWQDAMRENVVLMWQACVATFDISKVDRNYAFRNTLVILISFWSGYWLCGAFMRPFDDYMSVSLAVMLSEPMPGLSLDMNVKRLLGVTIGKSLTLIIMALVSFSGDTGTGSVTAHIFAVFIFMVTFAYGYYDNGHWSYVSCLIAGFGCYTLAVSSAYAAWSSSTLVDRYAEICKLTAAVVGRLFIDTIDETSKGLGPRPTILRCTRKLGWTFMVGGPDKAATKNITDSGISLEDNVIVNVYSVLGRRTLSQFIAGEPRSWDRIGTAGELILAMRSFWDGEARYTEFKARVDRVEEQVTRVSGMTKSVEGAAVFARGFRASLEVGLLKRCLPHINDILKELRTLQVIHQSFLVPENVNDNIRALPKVMQNSWNQLMEVMKATYGSDVDDAMCMAFQMLQMALEKEGSEPIRCRVEKAVRPVCGSAEELGMSTKDCRYFRRCREVTARCAVQEILLSCKRIQSSVRESGILLFTPKRGH